jgi:hypothetical protein
LFVYPCIKNWKNQANQHVCGKTFDLFLSGQSRGREQKQTNNSYLRFSMDLHDLQPENIQLGVCENAVDLDTAVRTKTRILSE